jgi:cyclase
MKRYIFAIIFIAMVAISVAIWAQRDFSSVQIATTHAAGNVYMLEGRGGNIGVSVGDDGVLIVDDQFEEVADKIRDAIKKLRDGTPKFVLNTHFHGDHTGGNVVFGQDASIIAHNNVRKRLQVTLPPKGLPVITFDESLSIHFNGEEIRVIHFPHSHTDGDSVIFFTKSNVVHTGDLFFSGRFPYVDLGSGGDVKGLTKNVGKILSGLPPDVKLIPGHGPLSGVAELKTYHRMLVETTAVVQEGIKAGKRLDQLKAAGLPEAWKGWGSGFVTTERWIETVYNTLTKDGQ